MSISHKYACAKFFTSYMLTVDRKCPAALRFTSLKIFFSLSGKCVLLFAPFYYYLACTLKINLYFMTQVSEVLCMLDNE